MKRHNNVVLPPIGTKPHCGIFNTNFSALILALPLALTILSSCGKDEPTKREHSIRPIISAVETKSTITHTSELNEDGGTFYMYAYADGDYQDNDDRTSPNHEAGLYFDTQVNCDGSEWTIVGNYEWINDVDMSFWSYSPASTSGTLGITPPGANASTMDFTFRVSSNVKNQDDLLFAHNIEKRVFEKDGTYDSSSCEGTGDDDYMDIMFHHALSCIRFAVSPDDGTFDTSLGIRKITLRHILGYGTCTYTPPVSHSFDSEPTFDWSPSINPSDLVNYELSLEPTPGNAIYFTSCPSGWTSGTYGSPSKTLYTMDDCFFMIPQSFSSLDYIDILLDNGITVSAPLQDTTDPYEWEADHYYTYKIKIQGGVLSLSLTVSPWDDDSAPVHICDYNVSSGFSWTSGIIDTDAKRVVVENGLPITGTFTLSEPIGGELLISLDGNVDAFKVTPSSPIIDGSPITVTVTPQIADPQKVYETSLHIYLIKPDGTAEQLDDAIFGTGASSTRYKITLPSN